MLLYHDFTPSNDSFSRSPGFGVDFFDVSHIVVWVSCEEAMEMAAE